MGGEGGHVVDAEVEVGAGVRADGLGLDVGVAVGGEERGELALIAPAGGEFGAGDGEPEVLGATVGAVQECDGPADHAAMVP